MPSTVASPRPTRPLLRLVVLGVVVLLGWVSPPLASAQDDGAFPGLDAAQRVYDETGSSLTPAQDADLGT